MSARIEDISKVLDKAFADKLSELGVKLEKNEDNFSIDESFGDANSNRVNLRENREVKELDKDIENFGFDTNSFNREIEKALENDKPLYDNNIAKEEKQKGNPEQCDNDVNYQKQKIKFGNRAVEYKVMKREADWGKSFINKGTTSKIENLENLNERIIKDIRNIFGSLDRITEIVVVDGLLILNGMQYYPISKDERFLSSLPFDCGEYFKDGVIAEIFDFGYLYQMQRLTSLKIDTMSFVERKLAYDIGITTVFRVELVFDALKSLKYLEIGNDVYHREDFYEKDSSKKGSKLSKKKGINEELERRQRFSTLYDRYLTTNAKSLSSWSFNNLKTYANTRGDKGFLKYSGGVLARLGMTGVTSAGAVGVWGIGKIVKSVGNVVRDLFYE